MVCYLYIIAHTVVIRTDAYIIFLSDLEDPTLETLDYIARLVAWRPVNLLGLS